MPNKIKIFLGFLALIALFSVYSVFNSLSGKSAPFSAIGIEKPLPGLDIDADHDGPSNRDESYWNTDFENPDTDGDGFLDGEEVASGHDPLKPGPDDLLDTSKNITAKVSNLIIGGLYTKDLKPGINNQKYDQAVSDLSLSVIDDFYSTQVSADTSLNLIDSSTEDQAQYLKNVSLVIKENLLDFPKKLDTSKGLVEQSSFFLDKANQYDASYKNLSSMPVPKNWESVHKTALDILNRLSINYTFMGSFAGDPLKSIVAMNEVQQNIQPEIKSLLREVQSRIKENKLNLDGDFYNVLNLLYP